MVQFHYVLVYDTWNSRGGLISNKNWMLNILKKIVFYDIFDPFKFYTENSVFPYTSELLQEKRKQKIIKTVG